MGMFEARNGIPEIAIAQQISDRGNGAVPMCGRANNG
jgi:hypothetical protein